MMRSYGYKIQNTKDAPEHTPDARNSKNFETPYCFAIEKDREDNDDHNDKPIKDSDLINTINEVVKVCSKTINFSYHSTEDFKQIAFAESKKVIDAGKYDPSKGKLFNFLLTHVKRRLLDLYRKEVSRNKPPCLNCKWGAWDAVNKVCTKHEYKMDCEPYAQWHNNHEAKKTLTNPSVMSKNENTKDLSKIEDFENADLIEHFDSFLPTRLLEIRKKIKEGKRVTKKQLNDLKAYFNEYAEEYDLDVRVAYS